MPKRPSPHPTEAELEILNVLWHKGPGTVREIHDTLQADRTTGLTTTLKIIQVMTEKGLLARSEEGYPYRYRATSREAVTQSGLVKDLINRAFDGSVRKLVVRAVEDAGLSNDELKEMRKLIDAMRKRQRGE